MYAYTIHTHVHTQPMRMYKIKILYWYMMFPNDTRHITNENRKGKKQKKRIREKKTLRE